MCAQYMGKGTDDVILGNGRDLVFNDNNSGNNTVEVRRTGPLPRPQTPMRTDCLSRSRAMIQSRALDAPTSDALTGPVEFAMGPFLASKLKDIEHKQHPNFQTH